MLEGLERLTQIASNVRLFLTSREVQEIRESMEVLEAKPVLIAVRSVDADIGKFIAGQLSRDRKLSKLDAELQSLIETEISKRADGMFRWAYCQLQELKMLKSSRPSHIKATLANLPDTLDETYERMLTNIEQESRADALTLLQWLAYARSPLNLSQLAEARIIDLTGGGAVLEDDRGGLEDALRILSGLITVDKLCDSDSGYMGRMINTTDSESDDLEIWVDYTRATLNDTDFESKDLINWMIEDDSEIVGDQITNTLFEPGQDTRIRLAHFTVKEYLESRRVGLSNASFFHLDYVKGQDVLAESCLVYLKHYFSSPKSIPFEEVDQTYPLLEYATDTWHQHSRDRQDLSTGRELALLQSDDALRGWLHVHRSRAYVLSPWETKEWDSNFASSNIAPALYYASALGLTNVAKLLLAQRVDVNAAGGYLHNALQAASHMGHKDTVQLLIDNGADVNQSVAHGPEYDVEASDNHEFVSALQAAAGNGHVEIMQVLIQQGANVNAQCGHFNTALQVAASHNQEAAVRSLIAHGADVNMNGGPCGTALIAASFRKYERMVKVLLDEGADVNAQGNLYSNALYAASFHGCEKIVEILIDRGADVNDRTGSEGSALQIAASHGHEILVAAFLDHHADVNIQGGFAGSALIAASGYGHEAVVTLLLNRGADVNIEGANWPSALYAAVESGDSGIASTLLDHGADVNKKGPRGSVLQAACARRRKSNDQGARDSLKEVINILIERGALFNTSGSTARKQFPSRSASESRIGSAKSRNGLRKASR